MDLAWSYWPITRIDWIGCHWIHDSVTSCSHSRQFKQSALYFCCVKARGSILYPRPGKRRLKRHQFQLGKVGDQYIITGNHVRKWPVIGMLFTVGGITYESRTSLVFIQGTMTAQLYISDVLQPVVLTILEQINNAIFQQ
ncbi:hypothetical protein LAZ67_2006267 [Cordylochernes scorpioides]|uniref:Uncharacterized protein n=1 Tax=Cordylochernes scorpioides TaxID=51811 RepID=A0ABY6K553_9ARAC|nr:hypothetical protein LAZ67_2006267 [Cordylochernes scorpioides]